MSLVEVHKDKINGVLLCYDLVIISGVAGGMTCFFNKNYLRVFDFATVLKPITEGIINRAEEIAAKSGVKIEYIRRAGAFRKEERIAGILAERGDGGRAGTYLFMFGSE
jgi:hypothetical protein